MKTIEHLLNYKPANLANHPHKLPDLIWKFLDILKSRPMNKSEIADYFKGDELDSPSIVDELTELNLIEIIEFSYEEWQSVRGSTHASMLHTAVKSSRECKNESKSDNSNSAEIEEEDEEVQFSIG